MLPKLPPPDRLLSLLMPEGRPRSQQFLARLSYLRLRLTAFLLDCFFVGYVYWAYNYIARHVDALAGAPIHLPWWAVLLLIVEVAVLWGSLTRSLGARILRLATVRVDGDSPTIGERLLRFAAWNLAAAAAGLGLLWPLGDRAWLAWHDRLTGTVVIVLGGEERQRRVSTERPPAWYVTSWGLAALLLLALSYGVGWIITEIEPRALFVDAHLVRPLVAELLHPQLVTRERRSQRVAADFFIPCPASPPTPTPPGDRPYLRIEPTCGEPQTRVTLEAGNLHPDTLAQIRWLDPLGNATRLRAARTDGEGRLAIEFDVPEPVVPGSKGQFGAEVLLSWEEGDLKIADAVIQVQDKMLETIFLALMATTLGVILAVPVSFLAARNLMARHPLGAAIYYAVRLFLNILRAIEPLIWAIIFAVWVGIGPYAGVLALTLHSIASLGKLYSEAIESIDPGPIEAITATGAHRLQTIVYAVIPQVIPPFISFTIYRWDINVRMSTVIGFVGGGGIGFLLIQWINLLQYRQAATAMWAIAIVVSVMDYLSAVIREHVV